MKFYPHGSGTKGQSVTYATVKDSIVSYVQRTYKHGKDIAISLRDLKKKDLSYLKPVRDISTETDEGMRKLEQDGFDILYQAEIKQFLERERALEENRDKAYALIFGTYCSKAIQSRVEEHPDYESKIRDNPIELLKTVSVLMHNTVRARYPYASLYDAMMRLFNLKQQENEHLTDYVKRFKQSRDVLKSHMGTKWLEQFMEHTEEYQNESDTKKKDELKDQSFERFMAFMIMRNSDQAKYRSLTNGLVSQYSMENDQYPKTITAATDILANHRHDNFKKRSEHGKSKEQEELDNKNTATNETSFAQSGETKCYCCGKKGHKSPQCPKKDSIPKSEWAIKKAEQLLQTEDGNDENSDDDNESIESNATSGTNRSTGSNCGQGRRSWSNFQTNMMNAGDENTMQEAITLDNGSTLSLFCNPDLVDNIRETSSTLELRTNAGTRHCSKKASVPGFGSVWFDKDAIANIFGFADLVKKYRITYDSKKEDAFLVHMDDGIVKFKRT
ncbi:hypothetical protein ACA910_013750 [Epithemia clementina (nom. ined.)]